MRCYIGLGSNLGDAVRNVRAGLRALAELGEPTAISRLYFTQPRGATDQPEFVNAVAALETELDPRELLDALKALEVRLGRVPSYRWGPRAIDFDILTCGDAVVSEDDLQIPHPRMLERAFVLVPLCDLDPAYAPARDALPAAELSSVRVVE